VQDPGGLLKAIKARGKLAGVSLRVREPVELLAPF
jgi:hypothetical protein